MNVRNMGLVAAAAAMIALAPSMTRAQDNSVNTTNSGTSTTTTTTSTTETTTEFVPINIPNIAPPPTGPNGEPINYTVLAGKSYDYMDLNQARAEGFSDHDIAVIAKIADKSGMPFNAIKHMALDGQAYPTIADRYNLRLADVLDANDYESQIADYRVAYETTGENAVRNLVAAYQEQYGTPTYNTTTTTVISPNSNLADVVNSAPELTMFARALRTAGMMNVLNGPGPLTIFAPTDAAFSKLSSDQINALMGNRDELVKILDYAIIPQRIPASQFSTMTSPTSPATLEGNTLQLTTSGANNLMVNGANIVKPDLLASNGIIDEVDTVLLPPSVTTITTTTTNSTTTNTTTGTGTGTGGSEGGVTVTPTEPSTAPNPTTEPGNTTNP
jgi:uncharacterized surface protein with fasciclin (FAS1) repeats